MSRTVMQITLLLLYAVGCCQAAFQSINTYPGIWYSECSASILTDTTGIPNPEPVIVEGLPIYSIHLKGPANAYPSVQVPLPSGVNMMTMRYLTFYVMAITASDVSANPLFNLKCENGDWGHSVNDFLSTQNQTLSTTAWAKVTIDFQTYWPQQKAWENGNGGSLSNDPNWVVFQLPGAGGDTQFLFAGYFGDIADYVPPPPAFVDPPIPPLPSDAVFLTLNQSPIQPDTGLNIQWSCQTDISVTPLRGYADLINMTIRAYRDTNYGSWPMNAWNDVTYTAGNYGIQPLWRGNFVQSYPAMSFPSPYFACMAFNADFFLIGNNTGKANRTLVVWAPSEGSDTQFIVAAYADWVKTLQDVNGDDTVTVHYRTRMPNYLNPGGGPSGGYNWVTKMTPNCTAAAPVWMCPDHIFMKDHQFGVLKTSLNWLQPLTSWQTDYFKQHGYDITLDLEQLPQSLATVSGTMYAVPLWITMFPWVMNFTSIDAIQEVRPPPYGNWGTAWWTDWNMTTWQRYMQKIYDLDPGNRHLFSIPVSGNGPETEFAAYTMFYYGATLLNATGRCGLDKYAEKALNETVGFWQAHPDMIYPRMIMDNQAAAFETWKAAAPGNPLEEPLFLFQDPQWIDYNTPYIGFDTTFGGGKPNMYLAYPPTGVAKARSVLAGLSTFSRDPDLAFDALMVALARNSRLHVNTPERNPNDQGMGVTAFRSTMFEPEYVASLAADPAGTDSHKKKFWYNLLAHATYGGYPVAFSSSYADILDYDPMNLAYNEMIFKGLTAKEVITRACTIINYATRPPCDSSYWKASLIRDSGSNKVTVNYTYVDDYQDLCRPNLALAQAPPPAVKDYTTSMIIGTQSSVGRAMIGVSAFGLIIVITLMALFLLKRDAKVIRAAAIGPSLIIFTGAIFTLASTIMRVSSVGSVGWLQCFGTYWFFAIGFGMVLGSLAMKSYRVDRIFRNRKPGFKFPEWLLMSSIGAIIAGEVVFLLIFQFWLQDDTGVSVVTLPNSDVVLSQPECKISATGAVALLYAYNALLIVGAATFAARTRNVLSTFNENTFTTAAISLISVITVVIVPVLNLIASGQAVFLLVGLGTFLATVLSVIVFAAPKLLMAFGIIAEQKGDKVGAPTGAVTSTSPEASRTSQGKDASYPGKSGATINTRTMHSQV